MEKVAVRRGHVLDRRGKRFGKHVEILVTAARDADAVIDPFGDGLADEYVAVE